MGYEVCTTYSMLNNNIMKKTLFIIAAAFALTACNSNVESGLYPEDSLYKITKYESQPFLGETYVNDYDFEAANAFLVNRYSKETTTATGACSSCRFGGFAGRNLDWYLKDYAILAVHMAANPEKGRYASIALCSSNPIISREMIASGEVSDTAVIEGHEIGNFRNNFPVFTTDGINEKGVCVNTNIVLHEDGVRPDYVPCTGHGGELISFVSLPRYVLDNCASCDDAIEKLSKLSVTQAYKGPLAAEDSHIMVSDMEKTVVFEWYNNEFVYVEYPKENGYKSANGLPCIMTNFYNNIAEKNTTDGVINWDGIYAAHPYAMGVERFQTLMPGLDEVNSAESMQNHIERVLYSKFFNPEYGWLTENAGSGYFFKEGKWYYYADNAMTKAYPAANFQDAMTKAAEGFQTETDKIFDSLDTQMKGLDSGVESSLWYTELTSIFDIENKELHVMPQEGWYKHEYIKFSVR